MPVLVEIVGWAGAILILLAYILLTLGRLKAQSVAYQVMNVAGSIGFLINGWVNRALPSAALNLIWMGIGVYALWKMRRTD
ncbi:MAG: hypothetical protein IPO97_06295 [Sphingomonadales bacterium]|nr:hypothetical protein [Sphingomonadales bacterium]